MEELIEALRNFSKCIRYLKSLAGAISSPWAKEEVLMAQRPPCGGGGFRKSHYTGPNMALILAKKQALSVLTGGYSFILPKRPDGSEKGRD